MQETTQKKEVVPEETKIIQFLIQDMRNSEERKSSHLSTYKPLSRFGFFLDQFGNASTSVEGVVITIDSQRFKDEASYQYFVERNRIFNKSAWDKALSYIKTISKSKTLYCPMRCYVNVEDGLTCVYYDQVKYIYKLTCDGSEFKSSLFEPKDSVVKFRRNQYTLPAPVFMNETDLLDPGAVIIDVMNKFKVEPEYAAILAGLFCDKHNQPISMFVGPAGSAKSTFQTFVKRTIDPTSSEKIKLRDKNLDWVTMIDKFYCLDFDNVRDIKEEEADDLCRTVTGGSILRRTLYTTNDLSVYEGRPRLLMNGISPEPSKYNDLLDRTVICNLERISDADRLPDSKIDAWVGEIIPRVRAACLMLLCKGYSKMWTYDHRKLPRMAEFSRLCDAIWVEMGNEPGEWIKWYYGKVGEAHGAGLDDEFFNVIIRYLEDPQNKYFITDSRMSHDLLNDVIRYARQSDDNGIVHQDLFRIVNMKDFPHTAVYFGRRLREVTPALQSKGIELTKVRTKNGSEYKFKV